MFEWEHHTLRPSVSDAALMNIESQLPDQAYIVLISGSFGDVVFSLLLVSHFSQIRSPESVVGLIPKGFEGLATRLLGQSNLGFRSLDHSLIVTLHRSLVKMRMPFRLCKGRVFPLLLTLHPYIAEAVLSNRMLDFQAKRLLLGLETNVRVSFPYDPLTTKEMPLFFRELGVRTGSTLVISPIAQSNPSMPRLNVERIINSFSSQFDIVINLPRSFFREYVDLERYTGGTARLVSLKPDSVFEFVKAAGYYIGAAQGLTSLLLCFDESTKIVLVRDSVIMNGNLSSPISWDTMVDILGEDLNENVSYLELVLENEGGILSDENVRLISTFFSC